MNNNLLIEILTSDYEYWLLARKCTIRDCMEDVRVKDDIILICIPDNIRRNLKYEDIRLKDLEELGKCEITENIFINKDYTPFQRGFTLDRVYRISPIVNSKKFLAAALATVSDNFSDYLDLMTKQ
jgi:hypothetical protein